MLTRTQNPGVSLLFLAVVGPVFLILGAAASPNPRGAERSAPKTTPARVDGGLRALPRDRWVTRSGEGDRGTFQHLAIPAGFFGPECDRFEGRVYLKGSPIDPAKTGNVDTIMERSGNPVSRLDPTGTVATVDLELKELSLVSVEPITVVCGSKPTRWNVHVGLSPTLPPKGWLTATKIHENGGTFDSTFYVQPLMTFTGVDDRDEVLLLDTAGVVEPIRLTATGTPFVLSKHQSGPIRSTGDMGLDGASSGQGESAVNGRPVLAAGADESFFPGIAGPVPSNTAADSGPQTDGETRGPTTAIHMGDGHRHVVEPEVEDIFCSTAGITVEIFPGVMPEWPSGFVDELNLSSVGLVDSVVVRTAPPYQDGVDIQTEIRELQLAGDSPHLGAILVSESPDLASAGAICEVDADGAGNFLSGDSYFNVYMTISVPGHGVTLDTGDAPVRLQAEHITSLPPLGDSYIPQPPAGGVCNQPGGPQTVPLYTEGTSIQVGEITHALHQVGTPCAELDLEIHKPKVIDPSEAAIPDAQELTKGAQTFVNLDNDDQDSRFDTMGDSGEDTSVAGEDEMTLLKLKVKPIDLVGNVTLSATAGGGTIKVWNSATKGTEVPLPVTYAVPADFPLIEGGWRVKNVWVEGRAAHIAQQETKLKMELNQAAVNNPDQVALTILGIDKIEWIGKENSLNDDNTLDADTNWPTGVVPGAVRVFPDARVVGGAVEANPRDKVDVKVTLTVDPVEPVKVYFDSFDVDDPSSATGKLDDSAGNEALGEDNRGTTPAKSGRFVKPDGSSDETNGLKEQEFSSKTATFLFQTTMQPGDNFRIGGNGDKDFLPDLENKDSDYAGNNDDKQRIVNKHVTGTAAQREIRQAGKYASDKVLTVWRFLHVEFDSMGPADNTPPDEDLFGIVTDSNASGSTGLTATVLTDAGETWQPDDQLIGAELDPNTNDANVEAFAVIDSNATSVTVSVLGVPASGFISPEGVVAINDGETFTVGDGGTDGGATTTTFEFDTGNGVAAANVAVSIPAPMNTESLEANIVAAINSVAALGVTASGHQSFTSVKIDNNNPGAAGNVALAETVADAGFLVFGMRDGTGPFSLLMNGAVGAPYSIKTDDVAPPGAPPDPVNINKADLLALLNKGAPANEKMYPGAYIRVVELASALDTTDDLTWDRQYSVPEAFVSASTTKDVPVSERFWSVLVLSAFDPELEWDHDPNSEDALRGLTPVFLGPLSETTHATAVVYRETCRDHGGGNADEAATAAHEITHSFGCCHYRGFSSIETNDDIMTEDFPSPAIKQKLNDKHLNIIRWCPAPNVSPAAGIDCEVN